MALKTPARGFYLRQLRQGGPLSSGTKNPGKPGFLRQHSAPYLILPSL
jgi:hypothetical protein